jgi:hypothetical protein
MVSAFAIVAIASALFGTTLGAAPAPDPRVHFLGDDVHKGLHGDPIWKSSDGLRAFHNFTWADASGRSIHLSYEAEKHNGVHSLDDIGLNLVAVDWRHKDGTCALKFANPTACDNFAELLGARDRNVLVGGEAWEGSTDSTPVDGGNFSLDVVSGLLLRVHDIRSKRANELLLNVSAGTFTDLFRNARLSFSHTVLREDFDHFHGQRRPVLHKKKVRGAHGRREDFWGAIGGFFGTIAKGIVDLASDFVNTLVNVIEAVQFGAQCASTSGCKFPEDAGSLGTLFPNQIEAFNFNAEIPNDLTNELPNPQCPDFVFGAIASGTAVDAENAFQGMASGDMRGVCRRCYMYAALQFDFTFEIQDQQLTDLLISATGAMGAEFTVEFRGAQVEWLFKYLLGTIQPKNPTPGNGQPAEAGKLLSFSVIGIAFSLHVKAPTTLQVQGGADASMQLMMAAQAHVRLTAGFKYSGSQWQAINDASLTIDPPSLEVQQAEAEVTMVIAVIALFEFNIKYKALGAIKGSIGGPIVPVKPYVELILGFDSNSEDSTAGCASAGGAMWLNMAAGIDVGLGGRFQIQVSLGGAPLIKLPSSQPWSFGPVGLVAYKKPLFNGCLLSTGCEDESIGYEDPTDSANTFTCTQMAGDCTSPTVGQTIRKNCPQTCGLCSNVPSGRRLSSTSIKDSPTAESGFVQANLLPHVGDVFEGVVGPSSSTSIGGSGSIPGFPQAHFSMQLIRRESNGDWRFIVTISGGNPTLSGSSQGFASILQEIWVVPNSISGGTVSRSQTADGINVETTQSTPGGTAIPTLYGAMGVPSNLCYDDGFYGSTYLIISDSASERSRNWWVYLCKRTGYNRPAQDIYGEDCCFPGQVPYDLQFPCTTSCSGGARRRSLHEEPLARHRSLQTRITGTSSGFVSGYPCGQVPADTIDTTNAGGEVPTDGLDNAASDVNEEMNRVSPPAPPTPPCFPSSATVMMANGSIVSCNLLREGDTIFAATKDGSITTDTISLWSLADNKARNVTFIVLTTSAGQTIQLTRTHHLPVGKACCSSLKQAQDVKIGDVLWTFDSGVARAASVVSKGSTIDNGLHNPLLTHGNFPIVDGIVSSFNRIEIVTFDAYAVPVASAICQQTNTCNSVRHIVASTECVVKTFTGGVRCKSFEYIDGLVVSPIGLHGKQAMSIPIGTTALALFLVSAVKWRSSI